MHKKILQEAVVRRLKTIIAEANNDYKYTFGNYEIELKNSQVYFKKNGMLVKVIDVNSTFGKYDFKQMAIKVAKGVGHSLTEDKADGYADPAYRATIKQFKGKKVSKQDRGKVKWKTLSLVLAGPSNQCRRKVSDAMFPTMDFGILRSVARLRGNSAKHENVSCLFQL